MTMPDFDQTQFQASAFLELKKLIQTQKIPNALLFSGGKNIKKREAAFFLAKGCNCLKSREVACNNCKSCRKIEAKSHPDILTIDLEKDKKIISISQIRTMGLSIASRPNEARFRMVLILNADKMNPQAQNALLKMVEEPPEKTFFVLIAQRTTPLLPTIISRCRKIPFKPMSQKHIEESLVNNFNVDRSMAYIAAGTAASDMQKAMMYLNLNPDKQPVENEKADVIDWIKKRKYLLKTLSQMIQADTNRCIAKGLMLSQKISLDTDMLDDTIAVIKTFFRDLMIFKYNQKQLINLDFADTLKNINLMVKSSLFPQWLEGVFEIERQIASNSSPRLVLDKFFLKIAKRADPACLREES